MSRLPACASVTLAALLPLSAAALGLGEVEPKSYLNQPLSAEIPVLTDTPSEIAGLEVSLAAPDTYARYGLQRPVLVGDLQFAVVATPRGGVIRVTSPQPVMEPFITLLLEVRWPQGRLLREYTVLLDPPAFTGGAVQQPVETPAAAQVAESAPVTRPPAESTPAPLAPAAPAVTGAAATHTVARSETLWGIAERYRPEGADMNQVMLAIYRANPDAFAGNINRLNAGAVLRIPDRGALGAVAPREARAEVRRQNLEWGGGAARLELVPPAQKAAAAATAPEAAPRQPDGLRAEVEESRRLLAVKDAELQALRQRVAELEKRVPSETVPVPVPPPSAQPEPVPPQKPAAVTPKPAPATPAAPPAAAPAEPGLVDSLLGLLASVWLWLGAAVVLVVALLLARRRASSLPTPTWRPVTAGAEDDDAGIGAGRDDEMIVVEESRRGQPGIGMERRAAGRAGSEESPLERTISTDSPVNLDQADPLAEADFHMAYGLYDQAADLLSAAIAEEPSRRDLQLKLLDVYFVWENREGFLKEARRLRDRVGSDADPDWKRVVIMGKQLCPAESLFAGVAMPMAEEMDLALPAGSGTPGFAGQSGAEAALDFDLTGAEPDAPDVSPTVGRSHSPGRIRATPAVDEPSARSAVTMETPTIESPEIGSTRETPTIETWSPEFGGTADLPVLAGEERAEQTEEIDLDELGLDLTGLEDVAKDMETGLQQALPAEDALELDLSGVASTDGEDFDASGTLHGITRAMDKGSAPGGAASPEDTAEQPAIRGGAGAAHLSSALSTTSDQLEALDVDLGLDAESPSADLTATGMRALSSRRPEDPTMTEVGTKLDLARAYLDMGDPDGARSILNEVIEEGDPEQRQEARQLLDSLTS